MEQFCILLVDDDERILRFLKTKLLSLGYAVLTASNGLEALEQAQSQEPDLVVLDVVMPKMDGFETLRQLRNFTYVPVIFLSAIETITQKIKALSLGADDYLTKPFNPDELVARIEGIRRRLESIKRGKSSEPLSFGEVTLDFNRRSVSVRGEEIRLTRTEWLVLAELAGNVGRLMTHKDLLSKVWGTEHRNEVALLRNCVSRLRNKIKKDAASPSLIRNIINKGYIIDKPSQ